MSERELAIKLKQESINLKATANHYLGFTIPLSSRELVGIDIEKLITTAKGMGLYIDYVKNVTFMKISNKEKNAIFVYLNDYSLT